ncbi:MAG: RNA-binding protein [Bacteroidales bacterium]|nr:RNA-binding protein [Bacteroidales bacterium]
MNIYVGNLGYKVEEDELRDAFQKFGNVTSVKIITDKFTGKSKGFAFVEMENAAEAHNAIDALDGKEFDNRNITVNIAREKRENNRRY